MSFRSFSTRLLAADAMSSSSASEQGASTSSSAASGSNDGLSETLRGGHVPEIDAEPEAKVSSLQDCPVQGLAQALQGAQLERCIGEAATWCRAQGAVTIAEVAEDFEEFSDSLGLKKIEKKRLFRLLICHEANDTQSVNVKHEALYRSCKWQDAVESQGNSSPSAAIPEDPASAELLDCLLAEVGQPLHGEALEPDVTGQQPTLEESDFRHSRGATQKKGSNSDLPPRRVPVRRASIKELCKQGSAPAPKLAGASSTQKPSQAVTASAPVCAHDTVSSTSLQTDPQQSQLASSESLLGMISKCPLFHGLATAALDGIVAAMTSQAPKADKSVVFQDGSDAQSMFFVLSGEIKIQSNTEVHLATISEGGFFGEIGVLFAGRRTASAIVSKAPCQLAVLHRADLVKAATNFKFQEELYDRGQLLGPVHSWFLRQVPLFDRCAGEPGFLSRVADALVVRKASSGEVLIREGDEGREMFFIFDGSVSISKRQGGRSPVRLNAPHFFGELALLFNEPRSATVTCSSKCRLFVLEQQKLHSIMQDFPSTISGVYSSAQETASMKAHFIRKMPLFKSMSGDEEFMANVSMALESFSAAPGEFLVRQGVASDGRMFVIAHGHAQVLKVKHAGNPAIIVATLSAGAFFGEVALLLDTPRLASVVARGHCHVYTLSRDAFETLAVVYSQWWQELISEQGVLLKQIKDAGVGINAAATTRTHGLRMPEVRGASVSSMLIAAEASADDCRSIPEGRLCLVCRSAEKAILSVPCGHISACASCHEPLSSCPVCRASIDGGHRAFF